MKECMRECLVPPCWGRLPPSAFSQAFRSSAVGLVEASCAVICIQAMVLQRREPVKVLLHSWELLGWQGEVEEERESRK